MKKVLIVFVLAVATLPALAGIDDPAKPWSYFVHPVTCIGMPLQTARTGIQVTPEGTVFTGEHELALFFGDERKPLTCRQRRFVDDMPIVEDEWRDGVCHYRWSSTLRERMRSSPRWANRMTGRLRRRKSASVPKPTRASCCTVRT